MADVEVEDEWCEPCGAYEAECECGGALLLTMDDAGDYEDLDDEEAEEYDAHANNVIGPNGPRVCAEKCETCIFRPGNPMDLRPGRVQQMVKSSLQGGGFITCHSTLLGSGNPAAVCKGFFDSYGEQSNLLRVYGRLGGFDMVKLKEKEEKSAEGES